MVTINNPINNTVGGSNSGVNNTLTVTNSSNTASSQALVSVTVGGGTAGDPFTTYTVSGVTNWSQGIDNSASDAYVLAASTALGTTNVMSASTAGEINYPLQPAFLAFLGTTDTNFSGDSTVFRLGSGNALTEVFDQNADFNTNGTFTAPVTGRYLLGTEIFVGGGTAITSGVIQIVTSNRTYQTNADSTTLASMIKDLDCLADMDAADTAIVNITTADSGGKVDDLLGNATTLFTYFYGQLTC